MNVTVKGPLTMSALIAIKTSVTQNVQSIPGVRSVTVSVTGETNRVIVDIKAQTVSGIVSTSTEVQI